MARLFIGGHSATIQGEINDLGGDRCFSVAHSPNRGGKQQINCSALLDSGAFSGDDGECEEALCNQLHWEEQASKLWGYKFQSEYLASRDYLIPQWYGANDYMAADWDLYVEKTIEAAKFLSQSSLGDRIKILGCQGASISQYRRCVDSVLNFAQPDNCIGLGGWRNIGIYKSWQPSFEDLLCEIIPLIATAEIKKIHIYGVLYLQALGRLQYICDQYQIQLSTDSCSPMVAARNRNGKYDYWRDEVEYWRTLAANIQLHPAYKQPQPSTHKQLELFT